MNHHLTITIEAAKKATPEQITQIFRLVRDFSKVEISVAAFDLPDGYLSFCEEYENGMTVVGGISPDGRVST